MQAHPTSGDELSNSQNLDETSGKIYKSKITTTNTTWFHENTFRGIVQKFVLSAKPRALLYGEWKKQTREINGFAINVQLSRFINHRVGLRKLQFFKKPFANY